MCGSVHCAMGLFDAPALKPHTSREVSLDMYSWVPELVGVQTSESGCMTPPSSPDCGRAVVAPHRAGVNRTSRILLSEGPIDKIAPPSKI